jgi:sugar/nucleoside kinase (ribokinase family)
MVVTAPLVVVVGDVITDLIVRPREPIAAASDTRAAIAVRPGGSGANTAAWLAVQRAEGPDLSVHFIGRVGRDPFGVYHDGELRRQGVTPHLTVDERRSTGTIVALVDGAGERDMLTDRGANLGLRREDLPPDLFRPGASLHLSGYTLFEPETRDAALTA